MPHHDDHSAAGLIAAIRQAEEHLAEGRDGPILSILPGANAHYPVACSVHGAPVAGVRNGNGGAHDEPDDADEPQVFCLSLEEIETFCQAVQAAYKEEGDRMSPAFTAADIHTPGALEERLQTARYVAGVRSAPQDAPPPPIV